MSFRQTARHQMGLGYLTMALAIGLFSTIEVFIKLIGPEIPPLRLAFLRFELTGLILLIPSIQKLRRREKLFTSRDAGILLVMSLIGVTLAIGLYHLSLRYLPANIGAIVFSANPVFIALFAPWILKERVTFWRKAALAIGVVGVGVMAFRDGHVPFALGWGILLMLASEIFFALYSVLSKKYLSRYGARVITCCAGIVGGAALLPFSWALEGAPFAPISGMAWIKLAYLVVGATALAYILYFHGMARLGAARGAMFFFMKPVLASVFAWLILGEQVTAPILAGGALIVAALAASSAEGFAHRHDQGRATPMR